MEGIPARAIGRKRRRGIAGGGAGDGLDGRAFGNHLFHLRHEDGHAEVLKGTAVSVAAEFDPEIIHADDFAETFGPEKIGAAFVERDDIFVLINFRQDPFVLAQTPEP